MTEQELIKIMGKPQGLRKVNADEIDSRWPGNSGDLEALKREHKQLIEYNYVSKRIPGSSTVAWIPGIFLDEKREKIVLLQNLEGWLDQGPYVFEFVLIFGTCIIVPWLGLWFLCRRRLRKTGA